MENATNAIVQPMHRLARDRRCEQVGDLVAEYNASRKRFQVEAIWCENSEARITESRPSCDRKRACHNHDARRHEWTPVGEYHTHPAETPMVHRVRDHCVVLCTLPPGHPDWVAMKPPSHSDIYQLVLATYNEQHACMVVMAPEGVYWYEPTWASLRWFRRDIHRFYRNQRFSDGGRRKSLRACRQPSHELVTEKQYWHLHRLLNGLQTQYFRILREHRTSKEQQITRYHPDDQLNDGWLSVSQQLVSETFGIRTNLIPTTENGR